MVIETERLLIRTLEQEDFSHYHEIYSDKRILGFERFEPYAPHQSSMQLQQAVDLGRETEGALGTVELGIELKSEAALIGIITPIYQDVESAIIEIGILMRFNYQQNEYAFEAMKQVIDLVFSTTDVHRIVASTNANNLPCIRLLEKLGMSQEGILRKAQRMPDGHYDDIVLCAILKSGYFVF